MIQWDLFGTWMLHVQASCGDYSMQCDCKFCILYAGCPNNSPSMNFVLTVHISGIRVHLLTNFPDILTYCPCFIGKTVRNIMLINIVYIDVS